MTRTGRLGPRGHRPWLLLLAALAVWLLLAPQPAYANVSCTFNPTTPPPLAFGSSSSATGTVGYSCQNFDTVNSRSFTLCLGVGDASSPGTQAQPLLQNGANTLKFNVYKDSGATTIWTKASPITASVTVPRNATVTGSFTYYGRIASGQTGVNGAYQAYFYTTILGFPNAGTCQSSLNDLNGSNFSLQVTYSFAPTCDFGTISAVDFGTKTALTANVDATGTVQLTCNVSMPWTLTFGGGQNASGGVRRMKSPANNYISYSFYSNAARTTPIAINGTATGTGTAATVSVYGRVAPAAIPAVATYSDVVVVTLSF